MGRKIIIGVIVIAALIAAAYFLGPRVTTDTQVTFDASAIGDDPDAYLAAQEARFDDIRDGQAKGIVWAYPASKARTPLALVYVHGFSASRGETTPLTELIGAKLGANIYHTRLAGHGRTGEALATASVNAWVNDFAEAMAIGRRIGEQVVVISVSTGGGLAAWASLQPELATDLKGLVMISPNFQVKAGGAALLTGPWGAQLANLLIGAERSWKPRNEAHGRFWTTTYPTAALLPMAALTQLAREAPYEDAQVPALFVFADDDTVVDHSVTRDVAARWGAPHEMRVITESGDKDNHVIAGDALSPSTTEEFAEFISEWIEALP